MVVKISVLVLWVVMYGLVDRYERFRGLKCCWERGSLHRVRRRIETGQPELRNVEMVWASREAPYTIQGIREGARSPT
jgi:hypothetical protein